MKQIYSANDFLASAQENKEYQLLKEQYEQVLRENQSLMDGFANQPIVNNQERDTRAIGSILY